jgi:hypothetical protein
MLLVVDEGSLLPMGGWLSEELPTSRELGLALYQAIWHPGMVDWPLHGIPEVIRIPRMLISDEINDIKHAATYLMTELIVVDKMSLEGKSRVVQMRSRLGEAGVAVVSKVAEKGTISLNLAFQMLMRWLIDAYFPNHRAAPVPADLRRHGVSMAGHDTPAAGWLLPPSDSAETDADSVVFHGHRYTSRWFRSHPQQLLKSRAFPMYLPAPEDEEVQDGIFVEVVDSDSSALHYVTRKK